MDNKCEMALCPNTKKMVAILEDEGVTRFQMYSPAATVMSEEEIAGLFLSMYGRMSSPEVKDAMKMEFF